jgi:hypothetical protein
VNALAWATIIVGLPPWVTAAVVVIVRFARLVDAVESLVEVSRSMIATLADHEKRLTKGGL